MTVLVSEAAELPDGRAYDVVVGQLRNARGAFELCRYVGSVGGSKSLRRCLQNQHDNFIDFLNSDYWEAVKTGT